MSGAPGLSAPAPAPRQRPASELAALTSEFPRFGDARLAALLRGQSGDLEEVQAYVRVRPGADGRPYSPT